MKKQRSFTHATMGGHVSVRGVCLLVGAVLLLLSNASARPVSAAGNPLGYDGSTVVVGYNAGTAATSCTLTVYNGSGAQVASIGPKSISAQSWASFSAPELTIAAGRYSAQLTCTPYGTVAAVVLHAANPAWGNATNFASDAATPARSSNLALAPMLANQKDGWSTQIVVFNPEAVNVTVNIDYRDQNGNFVVTRSATIAPKGSYVFSQAGDSALAAGVWYNGKIYADGNGVAAEVSMYNWGHPFWATYAAPSADDGLNNIVDFPFVYKSLLAGTWINSITVQNLETAYGSTATLTYYNASPPVTQQVWVPAGGTVNFTPPAQFANVSTSARLAMSPAVPVAAISLEAGPYERFRVSRGIHHMSGYSGYFPLLMRNAGGYNTAVTCMNLSGNTQTLKLHYSNGSDSPNRTAPSLQSVIFGQTNDPVLADGDIVAARAMTTDPLGGVRCVMGSDQGGPQASISMDPSFAYDAPSTGGILNFPIFTVNASADPRQSVQHGWGTQEQFYLDEEAALRIAPGLSGDAHHQYASRNLQSIVDVQLYIANPTIGYGDCMWSTTNHKLVWWNGSNLVYDDSKCQSWVTTHPGKTWMLGNEPDQDYKYGGPPTYEIPTMWKYLLERMRAWDPTAKFISAAWIPLGCSQAEWEMYWGQAILNYKIQTNGQPVRFDYWGVHRYHRDLAAAVNGTDKDGIRCVQSHLNTEHVNGNLAQPPVLALTEFGWYGQDADGDNNTANVIKLQRTFISWLRSPDAGAYAVPQISRWYWWQWDEDAFPNDGSVLYYVSQTGEKILTTTGKCYRQLARMPWCFEN